ncbi:arginine repressor [Klebsiella oxytoca]|uniref:arginine repressor n=1 Tax=Klebsiella oxytoca TaxID=571 RepID=UPI00388DDDA5|nr:ArgR family transcriptional regulator [Klebsiella oxytoca]HCB2157591.1 ArgR family transcriptional regulator [Klebsiella oxytoca]
MEKKKVPSWINEQQRLTLCRKLIMTGQYSSQEEIRSELKKAGYKRISQSSVSRMLTMLGVIKIRNARGVQVYSLHRRTDADSVSSELSKPLIATVVSVEHNNKFILVHTTKGYGRVIANFIESCCLPEVLGVIAVSNVVWIAPRNTDDITFLYQKLDVLLKNRALLPASS